MPGEERGPSRELSEVKVLTYARTPSRYTEDMPKRIHTMAMLGLTIQQMADSSGIPVSTLREWLQNRPEIREAYETGKDSFDFDVMLALRRKALGYEYEREKTYTGVDSIGRPWSRTVTEVVRVEGDVTAQKFWLSNRQPEMWREGLNAGSSTNIQVNNINMDNFSEEERQMVRSMAIKQLEGTNVISGDGHTGQEKE